MLRVIVNRIGSIAVVMLLVALMVFSLIHMAPGDPAAIIAGDNATSEQIASIRDRLGLGNPLPLQFLNWIFAASRGDLGVSIFSGVPVFGLICERLEPTLSLTLITIVIALMIAVTAGVLAAANAGSWIDRAVMALSILGFSAPIFVVGYVLIYVFAIQLKWLPVQGYASLSAGILDWLRHLVLPALSLGLAYVALIARITRTAMLDVLAEDYIRTAKAKGVSPDGILIKHALRNAGIPIVTVVGIGVALLIGGVVITESVFNIPGVGRLVVDAISKRDYPIIQGVTLVFSGVYVLINLMVDLSYGLIDPRIGRR
ncbi:ABC transporter permease [Bradyrhizobium sp. BR 10289]|uniref:ABC transporter permease n=1 Tax=Bradyrhizobium sp. BR 10289 TaxID=2749993 RepID=UPI001C653510|nr:ABC transporter permease [Bradyrhizobium sp. BR 10289]MBW7970202.1 ABC transporter permease [Bradyrhizobium sp. BR 10289]